MTDKPTTITLRRHWKLWTDNLQNQTRPVPTSIKEFGIALDMLEAAEAKIDMLNYRHECLKSLYEDVSGYEITEQVDIDINNFISEQESQ